MISTSRHPACLMASAARKISAFVMLTSFMCENVVGPIGRASRQSGDETANPPASPWSGIFMRKPGSLGVGFLFMLFSQAFGDRHFREIELFPARDLAKTGSRARSCAHET